MDIHVLTSIIIIIIIIIIITLAWLFDFYLLSLPVYIFWSLLIAVSRKIDWRGHSM